jgi:hypothetical protein
MTDKNLTEIVAILDRSGSMRSFVSDTIGGYNKFIEDQKKGEGRVIVTLAQFDNEYQIDYSGVDINDVKLLDETSYCPRGWTALCDAVGRTINEVGNRLSNTEEDKRPGQVIFVIITDGQENSSKEFLASKVKEMVSHQTEKYNWSFIFLGGGDLETQKVQAASIGIAAANSYNYSANAAGTEAVYTSLSSGVSRRRDMAVRGLAFTADSSLLNDEEKKALIK